MDEQLPSVTTPERLPSEDAEGGQDFETSHRCGEWEGLRMDVAPPRAPAVTVSGEVVPGEEIEAAARLSRLPLRLGFRHSLDGFRLYRMYVLYKRACQLLSVAHGYFTAARRTLSSGKRIRRNTEARGRPTP